LEKRQGTKSRKVSTQRAAGAYGDLCAGEVMVVMGGTTKLMRGCGTREGCRRGVEIGDGGVTALDGDF
jgi:hypothetical protein